RYAGAARRRPTWAGAGERRGFAGAARRRPTWDGAGERRGFAGAARRRPTWDGAGERRRFVVDRSARAGRREDVAIGDVVAIPGPAKLERQVVGCGAVNHELSEMDCLVVE